MNVATALESVDQARRRVSSVHPELCTPVLFAALQEAFLRLANTQDRLLYQLDQLQKQNGLLLIALDKKACDG